MASKRSDPWGKLSKPQQSALWQIQREGGLMLTIVNKNENPYTTRTGTPIDFRLAKALIESGELQGNGDGMFGANQSWRVAHPKETVGA